MGKILLHLGSDAAGLASIVPIFASEHDAKIYLIDDDDTLENENHVFYWANLKLHKSYQISSELGLSKKEINITCVLDCSDFDKIKPILNLEETIYFSLNLDKKGYSKHQDLIEFIILHRDSKNLNYPLIILDLDYLFVYENHEKPVFLKKLYNYEYLHQHFKRVTILNCSTDVLCSLPIHKHEHCIVYSEMDREFLLIEYPSTSDIWDKGFQHDFLKKVDLTGVIFISSLEYHKNKYLVFCILRYLLAILTIDADHLYIFGYLKFGLHAKKIARETATELAKIFNSRERKNDPQDLLNFIERLNNFGSNVTQILPLSKKEELEKLYLFLLKKIDDRFFDYEFDFAAEIRLVRFILNLLYNQINSTNEN